ncbi:hypothetical protein BC834DRAFT_239814 [Gloeopeniophorella convolvens]|nr:hypothetical protein BC834DRAFT_239814 [Gloeopeniophorella convolvens]
MASDQLALTPPGQPASQNLGSSHDPLESLHRRSHLRLKIIHAAGLHTVTGLPGSFAKHRHFYVIATDGVTTRTTKAIRREKQLTRWDETFDSFTVDPSSRLTLRLFVKRDLHSDALVGVLDLSYPELIHDSNPRDLHVIPIHLSTKQSQQITLRLEITIDHAERPSEVAIASSASMPPSISGKVDDGPTRSPSSTPSAAETIPGVPSIAEMLDQVNLPAIGKAAGRLAAPSAPVSSMANVAEQASGALYQAGSVYDTWSVVLTRMKWVVDCTEKIAEIHPYAKTAWGVLSLIPNTIFAQVERDENVKALVLAMHDALDLARDASTFERSIRDSAQRDILKAMLVHSRACGEFVQTYAKDTEFWKRLRKNTGRGVDSRVESYCSKLVALRDGFLRHATVTIEKTIFQVLDEVVDGNMSAKIEQIPYPSGASFLSDKGCLAGTRTAFLNYITSWVEGPDSESTRALMLFGQAGTGKSSIAHEVAHRFREIQLLASSFMFLRGEQSKQEPHLLFTGLVRDLSDRYPAFRSSLGKAIQYDTSIRQGTKDLSMIFKTLLLQPLKDTNLVSPVFVVIDALDEASGVTGRNGVHTFLADHIHNLPPNFRILITSRPEHNIKRAFDEAESISAIWMNNPELSSASEEDIHAYLKHNLPADIYHEHGERLARKTEGLFQWAAAACRYIQEPPGGLTEEDLAQRLLEPSPGHHPLDALYSTILTSYFDLNDPRVRRRYQSVMGQLFSLFEPLSSLSLTDLRRYSHPNDADSDDSVSATVRNLGSLLSNVAPADSGRPISPLHTSFRDFLTSKDRAGEFWIDVAASHRQMAYCCLGLLIDKVHFNICKLVSSYQKNLDVPDIHSLVSRYIFPSLSYASRFLLE